MKNIKEFARKYQVGQTPMLRESRNVCSAFKNDQTEFGNFDKEFKTPFDVQWLAAIKEGEDEPDDDSVTVDMKLETELVAGIMEACRKDFQGIKYFIEKAFPTQRSIWQKFGYTHYEEARHNHDKMFRFMTNYEAAADYYKDELIAAGYTLPKIAAITTLKDSLNKALTDQGTLIDGRPGATDHRIEILNFAYDFRQKVAKAAKEIFAVGSAKYELYLLSDATAPVVDYNFEGTTTEVGTGYPLNNVKINLGNSVPLIFSNAKGLFGAEGVPDFSYTALVSLDGYMERNISINKVEGVTFVIHIELEKYKPED